MRPSPKKSLAIAVSLAAATWAPSSRAADTDGSPTPAGIEATTTAHAPSPPADASPKTSGAATVGVDLESDLHAQDLAEAPLVEAPPPPPYKRTLVLDATVGALFFGGKFASVAGPAPWIHAQLGYEFLDWLMVFGEGELAFADTSRAQGAPHTRAFPIFGFGGGARFTWRVTPRVGLYLQGSVGAMKADVAKNALAVLGFKNAESLGVYAAGRTGVEWYQRDRHFALGLGFGLRDAAGFSKTIGSDTPLAFDAGASLRYAF